MMEAPSLNKGSAVEGDFAVAKPMPLFPPVMTAAFPSNRLIIFASPPCRN
jgi:hypothetical protein